MINLQFHILFVIGIDSGFESRDDDVFLAVDSLERLDLTSEFQLEITEGL